MSTGNIPKEILDKVAKLRALMTSDNINESTAAAAAAAKIIDKYRISEAELEMNEPATVGESIELEHEPLFEGIKLSTWRERLAATLAKHYGCAAWINNGCYHHKAFRLCGRKSDVELVRYMFSWLSVEIDNKAIASCKGMGKNYSNSWRIGAVSGVSAQFANMRTELKKEQVSTALARIENRAGEADAFMRENLRLKRPQAQKSNFDYNAFRDGQTHGKSIHLGKSMGTGDGAKMLGSK
jgi:hypothetical protein